MSDLIKREEVIEALKLLTDEGDPYDEGYNLGLNTAILEVKKYIPTAEPKVGKWIDHSDEGYVQCPFCGSLTTCEDNIDELHYCFNCGSRMRGEKDE